MATILVVDDQPEVVEIVRIRLEKDGHQILSATDGTTGLSEAKIRRPDLVILDVMMPGIDGFEVLRRLKSSLGSGMIPVIMLTAKDDPFSKEKGRALNVDRYVVKPFDANKLAETVKAVLANRGKPEPT